MTPYEGGYSVLERGAQGILMAHTDTDPLHKRTIECPVCHASGPLLRHDIRGSLVYFCQRCEHEWQIDPAEEPLDVDSSVSPGPLRGQI